jgi:hypothetical protein
MLHRTIVRPPNFHSLRFIMTPALNSKSFKSAPAFEINATVRELVAAMPIVLFYNAVRAAFSAKRRPTAGQIAR